MSNCPSEIILLDYLEGRLTSKKREEVYNHILNCRDCLEALAQVQRIPSQDELDKMEGPRKEIIDRVKAIADRKKSNRKLH